MPVVSNGVVIPVGAEPDDQSFQDARRQITALDAAQKETVEQSIERTNAVIRDAERRKAALKASHAEEIRQIKAQEAAARQAQAAARQSAIKTIQIGRQMAMAGGLITAPLLLAARQFVSVAGDTDEVAKRHKTALASMEESTMRVGRATADFLNPALEATAKVMKDVVNLLDENPAVLKGILAVGGGLAALGTITSIVGTIQKTVTTLAALQGAGAAAAGAGGAGAAGAGGAAAIAGGIAQFAAIAAPIVLAALLAAGAVAIIGGAIKEHEQNAAGAKGAVALPPGMTREEYEEALRRKQGLPPAPGGPPTNYGRTIVQPPTYRRRDFEDIEREGEANAAVLNYKKQFEAERIAIEKQASESRLSATESFEKRKASIEEQMRQAQIEYLRQDAQMVEDYYNRRADIARAHGVAAERAEYDHRKRIQQIERASRMRLESLIDQRDALGVVREKKAAEQERQDEEERYREEVRRRDQDFAEQLRQMDREFAITRARRREEFEIMQAARQAEVAAAWAAYQEIIAAINAMYAAMSGVPTPNPIPENYKSVGGSGGGGGGGSGKERPASVAINVTGNSLGVSQTAKIARNEAAALLNRTLSGLAGA